MYIYFDIGGTKTRVGISHDGKQLATEPRKFETPKDFDTLITTIHDTARELDGDAPIEAAGGGIACPVDHGDNDRLCWAPNLPQSWFEHSLSRELGTLLHAPVFVANDTEVIGLGEVYHGAAQGYDIAVYMTVSTGVGGARIVNGKIDLVSISAEPGRQYIDFDKSACPTCEDASMLGYASGAATERRFGMKPYEVADPAVWEEMAVWCAYMLNNTILHWSPQVVVLGGSMIIGDPAIPVDRIEEKLTEILQYPKMPAIKKAALGDFGGMYGAMVFVADQLSARA